jgi:hypothetical protein
MKVPATLKRVPKWAWYTTGGIVVGTFAIRMFQNRTTADGEDPLPTTTDDGTGTVTYGGTYGSAGVIVPPVIAPASENGSAGMGIGLDIAGLFVGGVNDLFDSIGGVYANVYDPIAAQSLDITGGLMTTNSDTIGALLGIVASAGDAPVDTGNTQAPETAGPVVIGGTSQPTTARPMTCASLYPNFPKHAGSKGQPSPRSCYREKCVVGKDKRSLIHRIYKNGSDDRTTEKCDSK